MQSNRLQLFVAQLPQLLPAHWYSPSTLAVVIDTLRFTTTAAVALQAGADSATVAAEVDGARKLANDLGPQTLLCGERHCHRIDGFHLGNSPFEYTPAAVAKKQLVFSTTNGTVAVAAANAAQQIVLGSLINRSAVAQWIVDSGFSKVWVVCAGTDGQVALEDVLTAGGIARACIERQQLTQLCNDSAILAAELYSQIEHGSVAETQLRIVDLLSRSAGGRNLIKAGFEMDIAEVAKLDSLSVVPHNSREHLSTFQI
jgi:2-phosphosulfolactate phosphatase